MNFFIAALKKYADFSGRARRQEYWMFILFYILFYIAAAIIDGLIISSAGVPFPAFIFIYALAMIIPTLAISVRRMHDINKSGAMILVSLIPLIGGIWFLILTVTEGTTGDNQYGPDPKASVF